MNLVKNIYPPKRPESVSLFQSEKITIAFQHHCINPDFDTILLFYGFDGSIRQMDIITPYFDQYNFIIADCPGHCYSPTSNLPVEEQLREYRRAISEILSQLNINSCHLVGYSFGGINALEFYLENKEKIKSFVFLNSSVNFRYNLFKKIFYHIFESFISLNFNFLLPYFAIPILTDKYFDQELLQTSREISLYNDPKSVLENFHFTIHKNLESKLAEIQCPVFLIGHGKDILVETNTVKKMAKLIPNSEILINENFGHITFASLPQKVAAVITNWLDQFNNY